MKFNAEDENGKVVLKSGEADVLATEDAAVDDEAEESGGVDELVYEVAGDPFAVDDVFTEAFRVDATVWPLSPSSPWRLFRFLVGSGSAVWSSRGSCGVFWLRVTLAAEWQRKTRVSRSPSFHKTGYIRGKTSGSEDTNS